MKHNGSIDLVETDTFTALGQLPTMSSDPVKFSFNKTRFYTNNISVWSKVLGIWDCSNFTSPVKLGEVTFPFSNP